MSVVERNTFETMVVKPSRRSTIGQLIANFVLWNMLASLVYLEWGITLGICASLLSVLISIIIIALFVPKCLELNDNCIVFTKALPRKSNAIFYRDIEVMEFENLATGRGEIRNYYLVTKFDGHTTHRIPLGAFTANPKEQAKVVSFILQKNSQIQFPYRLSQYNDWVYLST